MKVDFLEFMNKFHSRGRLSRNLGAASIALIPEKSDADNIKDFRPISLIGSVYKILAKVLAGRLRKVLPTIISHSQGAFVHGMQILDGVLIASKCIRSRYRDKIPSILCKLDLEKAYDSYWDLLLYMLRRMGFGVKWRGWTKLSVSSPRLSILINDSPKGFFKAQRG